MYSSPNHPMKPSCNSSSITELLGTLCDSSLSGVSWKRRALGGVSKEGFRRALKRRAYGALLSKLFLDGSKVSPSGPSATANTPPRNKVLMICFDLRVAGCREEAERLEDQLGRLPEEASSGLKEIDAVLELLVHLAGSAPPPSTSFNRDYMRRERPVLRRPQPWGYQSEELQRLEARAWGLVCGEEWGTLESLCETQGLMDAPPGTGLLALRTKLEVEERFEKDTRMTLFGALQHTRTSDIDIRLDLPPVPSNIDVTGLAIRVPTCLDQSEDEGFQSSSNLTPDSQSEPSPVPDIDIWDAVRTFEPGRRRCWESVGRPPGKSESLYITEGGREAFDQLYRLWEGEMRVVSTGTLSPVLPLDSQTQLVSNLLNVLIGVASTTFPLNQSIQFDVRPGVCISGTSPESVSRLLREVAQYGTNYLRLSNFSLKSADKKGLVFQAFTGGLRKYLHYYRACVLSTSPTLSLLTISFLFRKVGRQLRYLSELCCVDGPLGVGQATFPAGVKLLSYLYNEAQHNCSNENYPVLLSLLKSCCEPYTRFVYDWVYSGVFRDVHGEFMIQVNEEYLSSRDKHFWIQGYTLISKDVEDCVPIFLKHIANDVYVCGKTINLLKICCPQHYICWSELPVPRIAVTFSLQEVEEIERDCAVYRGRMERIAKHSAISREEQALRTEQARQELINQVRASTAKTLESIRGRQVSQRLAQEAKKRERFEEHKQHLEQEQEWWSAAKKKQEEDDFSFARELRDREKRLQALEEQLEQTARKELIAQYSSLSEEAARRERRALWRVQRMRLDEARAQFFIRDREHTEALVEKYPIGQERPPVELLPPVFSTEQTEQQLELSEQQRGETQESDAVPSPPPDPSSSPITRLTADPALISEAIDIKDFLPKSPNPDSQQVDVALQEIGSDLSEVCPTAQLVDYDFSAPFSPLEGIAGQASVQPRPRWGPAVQPDLIQNHPSFSHIPIGENISQVMENVPKASPFGQASKSSFPLGQYTPLEPQNTSKASVYEYSSQATAEQIDGTGTATDDKQDEVAPTAEHNIKMEILEMKVDEKEDERKTTEPMKEDGVVVTAPFTTPGQGIGDHNVVTPVSDLSGGKSLEKNTQDQISDVQNNADENISLPNIHTHVSRELAADVVPPQPSSSSHGHSSDANIKVGQFVSEVTAPLSFPNIHGHALDSHIQIRGHVSDVDAPLPSPSVHGHSSDSHFKAGENVSDFVAVFPTPNVHGHASDAHINVGEMVSNVVAPLPTPNVLGHSSDAHIKVGENVSDLSGGKSLEKNTQDQISDVQNNADENISLPNIHPCVSRELAADVVPPQPSSSSHGHSSDANIKVGQFVSEVTAPLSFPNIHGHASDSHIQIRGHVSDVDAPLPSPSVHGHSSDSHFKAGENVSDFVAVFPTPNVHGHASDAHINVGEMVSNVVAPLSTPNVHGHSSDAHIKVGENVSEFVALFPTANIHGHSSDANIKVGEFVSNVSEAIPRFSKHGHVSDCTLQPGCHVSGDKPALTPLPGSSYGHSSDSTLGGGCVVSGEEPKCPPLPGSAHGHSSDSNLGAGCVVSKAGPLPSPLPGSAYGHSSDSSLGIGCAVLGTQLQPSALPGSVYGHSSDSSLGVGCVVKSNQPKPEDNEGPESESHGEQLVEGMGSWAAGSGLSPREQSEREYLLALSAQYQVDLYDDCYNLMASSPECQLLKQVTRGPWGLPTEPTLRRATDTTAVQLSEMVSLPVLIKHSVTTPLTTHVSLVNKAVVDYFFVELGVERHFEALRHFLLMEDGEFAQSLSDLLFEKLGNHQTPGELLTPLVLNSILSKALQYSLHGDTPLAANFTFALRFFPETFHPHAPDSLNCLELRYKVDWPLNIIITDSCMNKYNRLFSFLLQLKHMVWSLRDVWFHLKRTALVKGAGRSVQFRQLQLYRHEMQHFVKVIQGYIANQILQVSWSEFTAKLATASDLDAIHRTHADYLNRAIFRGLLTEKAAPVMNIIHSIFSLILKFRAQLIAQPWDSQHGEAVHPSFIAMQQSYNTFKYYSHFLFKVVTKLVNRGYQPHLEDFLLRINFNNYYKDS
ncbi:gamma-tubulin complex component 6 isoform X1 [Hippoglossus hippoglossus]|uniref:gamma-tubulin complex component 6 isoform X1 n=1 Tax=Hippoglossus hippoglossus TaxID=8267 RepID=UPI00148B3903|nr:gamma-tubulin complex component 6 isoform X1 [Hippoglossus hippoglossus]